MNKNVSRLMRVAVSVIIAVMVLGIAPSVRQSDDIFEIELPDVPLSSTKTASGGKATPQSQSTKLQKPFKIPVPTAPGTKASRNDRAVIDFSNAKDGYIVVKHHKKSDNILLVLVDSPDGERYTYMLEGGVNTVLPLSEGDGDYTVGIYEQTAGGKFRLIITAKVNAELKNPLSPFLNPNQLVNFNEKSQAVKKAAELTSKETAFLEKISSVYNFVIDNVEYDTKLAKTVQSGYVPDIDAVLKSKKGICFDYASLMTAMLRSQGIPTKMVLGFMEDEYHAWINVYSDETGWINQVIFFDGKIWRLMDPTFAAGRPEFLVDESDYKAKYQY